MESAGLICKVDMTAGMKCDNNLHLRLWCTCHLNILTHSVMYNMIRGGAVG